MDSTQFLILLGFGAFGAVSGWTGYRDFKKGRSKDPTRPWDSYSYRKKQPVSFWTCIVMRFLPAAIFALLLVIFTLGLV